MPFIVPCVPTGMNTGVSTGPWGSVKTDTRALVVEHFAIVSKVSALFIFGNCWKPFLTCCMELNLKVKEKVNQREKRKKKYIKKKECSGQVEHSHIETVTGEYSDLFFFFFFFFLLYLSSLFKTTKYSDMVSEHPISFYSKYSFSNCYCCRPKQVKQESLRKSSVWSVPKTLDCKFQTDLIIASPKT
jgi:hypothetical protein